MTICFFTAQYLPTVGGVERYNYNLAKRLVARGHRVIVVTSAIAGLCEHEVDKDRIEIFRLPVFPLMGGRFPFFKYNSLFSKLAKQLWSNDFDVVFSNNLFYHCSIYAASQTKKRKIPFVLINHGTQYLMTGKAVLVCMGKVYEKLAALLIKRSCNQFFAVSGEGARWMESAFRIKATGVIYNAVEPDEILSLSKNGKQNWRAELGVCNDAKIVGFSGRLIPEKGVDKLCEAMAIIRKSFPTAVAVLAGDGNLIEQLRLKKYDGVFLVGQQSYENSLSLISQADVFCLPTRSEGFASTVLEAAALNTPIITTKTGGSTELILDKSCGLLLDDMSCEEIAQSCVFALGDENWRESASRKTFKRLCENFTWEKSADKLLAVVMSVLK